jgi:hypothetical protein
VRGGRVLVVLPANNQLCTVSSEWSTVRMEMHTTPFTTPAGPAASALGLAASPLRYHGRTVALRAAGEGRSTAGHAAPLAG